MPITDHQIVEDFADLAIRPHPIDEPKLRLLQAAECLFAEQTIESVSMREIALKAQHANTNAVQYHFGSREVLVQAIFGWRVSQMEVPRAIALAEAKVAGNLRDLPTLMGILCLPYLDLMDHSGRHTYAAFMSQYLLRQRPAGIPHAGDVRPGSAGSIHALQRLIYQLVGIDNLERGDYRMALALLVFCNMLVLADNEKLPERDPEAFRHRIATALRMATVALEAGVQ